MQLRRSFRTIKQAVHRVMVLLPMLISFVVVPYTNAQCNPQQTFKLLPGDGAASDRFGNWVGVSGTIAIVGAHVNDDIGIDSGSAYLFDTSTGDQIAKLIPGDGAAYDLFGMVAISGTTALVGASGNDDNGSQSGSAYIFDTTTGTQIAKLLPSDGEPNDYFGNAVAINGTTAIVGAPCNDDNGSYSGSAYLFNSTTGAQIAKLLPSDNAEWDLFGNSVDISGPTAIVASPKDDDNGTDSGSVYLFDASTGAQITKLLPSDGSTLDEFGRSVGISGTTVIVGAWQDDDNGSESGSAYLFNTITGAQIAKLLPSDGEAGDLFGESVAISDATAIVSAPLDDDNGTDSGSVYLFDASTGAQITKLLPSDGATLDEFGRSVGISGTTAVVGATYDDDNGNESGSAYLFDITCQTIGVDLTCWPASGTVPFRTKISISLANLYTDQSRWIAARIDATLANEMFFPNWRAGSTLVAAGSSYVDFWVQNIPALGSVIGLNHFLMVAEDVTPIPYNQPPYPPAGNTSVASCTVTGIAP